jgi:hypothetical protein
MERIVTLRQESGRAASVRDLRLRRATVEFADICEVSNLYLPRPLAEAVNVARSRPDPLTALIIDGHWEDRRRCSRLAFSSGQPISIRTKAEFAVAVPQGVTRRSIPHEHPDFRTGPQSASGWGGP